MFSASLRRDNVFKELVKEHMIRMKSPQLIRTSPFLALHCL